MKLSTNCIACFAIFQLSQKFQLLSLGKENKKELVKMHVNSHSSSYPSADMSVLIFIKLSQTKIRDFCIQFSVKQNVCRFDVTVDNPKR